MYKRISLAKGDMLLYKPIKDLLEKMNSRKEGKKYHWKMKMQRCIFNLWRLRRRGKSALTASSR